MDPAFSHDAFLLDDATSFLFIYENLIFRKRFGVATYFCFIFNEKKIKKENPKCNSLFGKDGL